MKKILSVLLMLCLSIVTLSACGVSDKKLNEALQEIGEIEFKDELANLSTEELATVEDLKSRKDVAYNDRDLKALEQIKTEWESFKAPIEDRISTFKDNYEKIGKISDDNLVLLSESEKAELAAFLNEKEILYANKDTEGIDSLKERWDNFFKPIQSRIDEVEEAYKAVGNISFSNESLLTAAEKNTLTQLKQRLQTAYKEKNLSELKLIKADWEKFKSPIQSRIDDYNSEQQAIKSGVLSGHYEYAGNPSSNTVAVIMKLTYFDFSADGTVVYHQSQCDFKGTYKKKGDKYKASFTEVEGPAAMVNNLGTLASADDFEMDITPADDGSLIVKAKGLIADSLGISGENKYKK